MRWSRVAKRAMDIGLVVLVAPIVLPVAAVIAVAVRLTSRGPVIYRARRVGRHMRPITLLKFRSMRVGGAGPAVTRAGDPRITVIGRILRSTKLDELPQLLNVLRGDMSLVGPRPEDPRYVASYTVEQRRVLSVRPGLLGPGFLHFGDEQELIERAAPADVDEFYRRHILPEKLAVDLRYVDGWTVCGDIRIVARTVEVLVARRPSPLRIDVRERSTPLLPSVTMAPRYGPNGV